MGDREDLPAFIDRVVRESRIADPREREELRREMESHFADVADAPDTLRDAMARFGSPAAVAGALERAHRRPRFVRHLLRLGLALGASAGVALVLQILTNLRRDGRSDVIALGPAFTRSASFSAFLVILLVAAWEIDLEPLCVRLERRPLQLLATLGGLALIMILFHAATNTTLPPGIALSASAVDVAIWTCTVAILARTDRAFARVFGKPFGRGAGDQ